MELAGRYERVAMRLSVRAAAQPGLVLHQNHSQVALDAKLVPGKRLRRFILSLEGGALRKAHCEDNHEIALIGDALGFVAGRQSTHVQHHASGMRRNHRLMADLTRLTAMQDDAPVDYLFGAVELAVELTGNDAASTSSETLVRSAL